MTLIDLCEIYAINTGAGSNYKAIFADIELDSRLQISDFCNLLFQRYGNAEPAYNTTNVFKLFSDAWFKRNADTIKRILDALELEYNPIENFDKHEKITRAQDTGGTVTGTGHATDDLSAFNSGAYVKNTQADNKNETKSTGTENETVTNETHGNIGVTTTQQMLTSELELRRYNLLEWIVDKYSGELLSSIY